MNVIATSTAYTGGSVGYRDDYSFANGCFWDTNTSGQSTASGNYYNDGITGETTAEMKTRSTFTDAGWDFANIWAICEVTNYPRLRWAIPAADFVCPDGIDFADYSFFAERWLNTNCASNYNCNGADFDLSGTVDMADLEIFCDYWLKGF
jgi:hypothetical protein